jgi:FkbM family methyltransferase
LILLKLVRGGRRWRWRDRLLERVTTTLDDHDYRFVCSSETDAWRARTLATKEAGTIEWIRSSVRPGQVFYDIGANIGLYTLVAARYVGAIGKVYAFEPHSENFVSLMRNIAANKLHGVVTPISAAVHGSDGMFDFNYTSLASGSSMSQLGGTKDADEKTFQPVFTEGKIGIRLDTMVFDWGLPTPDHIKIDVDGNELVILNGMQRVLSGQKRPSSLQVEINLRYRDELLRFMEEFGYEKYHRHDTAHGQSLIAAGQDPEQVAHNALFRPASTV